MIEGTASTSRTELNKAQCPCAGFPHCCHQENQSNEEKKPNPAVISEHQALSHMFLFLKGLAKPVLEMY